MRVAGMFRPGDYPEPVDDVTRVAVAELFGTLFPSVDDPVFDGNHAGIAVTAHNPKMALHLAQMSRFLALETQWAQRADLRELAIQTVNLHFTSDYAFRARRANALAAGIGADLLAALPDWRTSDAFDDEQRLVIAYAEAVAGGRVADDLFARVLAAYGETETIEFTTIVAFWSAWAMILNAVAA